MSISPPIFIRPLCLQIFFWGVVLQYLNSVQAVDLKDEVISRQNNLLERLSTQLSKIPSKDDLASLEAKFEQGIERERRRNADLKSKLQIMSDAMTKKMDDIQSTIDKFPGLVKFVVKECQNSYKEDKARTKRSTANLPQAIKAELDCRSLGDHRLVLLTTQWLQKGFNNFTDQLATVEKRQHEILKEIRNTSSGMSQGVGTILTEVESLKYYISNDPVKSCDNSNLTVSTFRSKEVICDKGWTVFQRRGTPTPPGKERTNFERNWTDHENGFGSLDGDFWLGLKTIHELTEEGYTQLRVDLEDWTGDKRYAMYDYFKVASSRDKYELHLSGYSGTAGNSLAYSNLEKFSTIDNENDPFLLDNCARKYRGGWWYASCFQANLNSVYHNSSVVEISELGVIWSHWKGFNYSLKKTEMKIRRPSRVV